MMNEQQDPVAIILARMEVKLDNALTEQGRHRTQLDRHDVILGEHGNRITQAETQLSAMPKSPVTTAGLIAATTLLLIALGVVAAFLGLGR